MKAFFAHPQALVETENMEKIPGYGPLRMCCLGQ